MENGVEMNDKPHLGETKLVEDGVSELEVSDKDVGGFHESKDSEGDEVFEEAVDAQIEDIQIQEQQPPPQNPDWGDGVVNGDVDVEKDRDTDPLEVGESANGGHEAENFEEAMELHLPTEDQGLEKVEDLEAVEPPMNELGVAGEVVYVEDNVKEVLAVESDGLVSRVVIGNVEDVEAVDPISEQHKVVENIVKEAPAVEPDGLASHGLIGNVEDVEAVESINELSVAGDVVGEENNVKEGLAVESDGLASHVVIGNVDDVETVEPITKPGVAGEVVDVKDNANEVLAVESDGMASDTVIDHVEDVEAVESVNELGVAGEVVDVKDNVNEVLAVESDGMVSDAVIGNVEDVETLEPVNELRVAGEVLGVENNVNGVLAVQSDGLASHAVIGNVEDVEAVEPVNDPVVAVEVVDVEDDDVKEVLAVESDGLVSDGMSGNVVEDVKDVAEVAAYEETEPLVAGGEANVRPDIIVEKNSENRDLDMVSLEKEILAIPEKLGNGDVHKVLSDGFELSQGNESIDRIRHQDDKSGELQDVAADLDTEHQHHVSAGSEDSSAKLDTSVDKEIDIAEDITTEVGEKIKADAVEAEAKDCIDSQCHSTDGNIKEGSHNHAEVEEPEKDVTQDEVEKNKPETEREPEIQSAADVGSSPGNSAAPAPHLPPRPAGLGAAAPLLEPAYRAAQQSRVNGAVPQRQAQLVEDPMNGEAEENDETREKLQMIRVKFLRLAHRLGQTPHNVVVAQVLYRLGLAEQLRGRNAGRTGAFSFERASAMAVQLEAAGQEPLDFSCTIMVLGKTGVGKSATINSIFDEVKFSTDAFQLGTKKVQDVVGTVQGIKVRVIDTPGLLPSWSDQRHNEKILHSVKQFIKKTPPDIVLYLDRLDMQSRDFGDMPLLRTITEIFGPSIWFNAIVVLTHAASAPPDGPNGTASSYEMFVTQRSHVVQQVIRQAAGDMRLMNPVSLVENHSACRTNRAGQRVLPNGQVWKPHLLLLSFASKILAEANTLLKLQDSPPGKPFATRSRVPPLPFLLSSLLQSRPQLKLPEEQLGDVDTLDEDLDEASDSDDESDYDELPPFKRLTKAQLSKLSKAQKKAYYDELEYREKLFMKKQLKEEKKRRKLLKKMAASAKDLPSDYNENEEEESGGAASVPVPMPDLSLPTSFDSDNPTHRYRCLDSSNQWLVRPVLETHGWDHDVGYEGINVERLFVVKEKIPLSFSGQVTKDKKESNLQMELASLVKHGEGKATSLGIDMQTVGKDMAYTLRSETRFSNFRHNKTAAGLSVTLLGDALTAGVKLEDKLIVNKRFRLVLTGGAMTGRGDVAYGGSLEATLRDKDYPLGRTLSTLGLSIMDWHGDLAIGCNLQSQFPIGRSTNMIARANLNNRGAGQVSIRLNSSEQLQIALVALVPLFRKLLGYSQQIQFGQ